jgi:hypothetical protein
MCFDSPVAPCEVLHEMVLIDETQEECAREHDCPTDRVCPLRRYFAERTDPHPAPASRGRVPLRH